MNGFEMNSKMDSAIESIHRDAVIDHRVFKNLAWILQWIPSGEKDSAEKDLVEAIEHAKELGRKIQSQNETIQIFKDSIFKEPMALVTIQAAGGERTQVLEQLLLQKSHYFDAMLSNRMIEGDSKLISFNDVGIQALEAVLWFLITSTLPCSFIQFDASEQVAAMSFACRIGLEKMLESVEVAFFHNDILEKNPELCLRIIAEGRIYIPSHDPTGVWLELRDECIEQMQTKLFRQGNVPNFALPECVFFSELSIVDLLDTLGDDIIDSDGRLSDLWLTESDLRMLDPTQITSTDQSQDLYTSEMITVGMQSRKHEFVQARLKIRRVEEKLRFYIFLDRTEHQKKIQNGTIDPDALDGYELNWAILMNFEIFILDEDEDVFFEWEKKSLGESSESSEGYYLSFSSDLPLHALSNPCIQIYSFIHPEQHFVDLCRQWLLVKEGQGPRSCFALWLCLLKNLDAYSLDPQEHNSYREIINTKMATYISTSFTVFKNIKDHYKDIHLLKPEMMALLLESNSLAVSGETFVLDAVFSWAKLMLDKTGQSKLFKDFTSGLTFHAITRAEPSEWNSKWIAGTIVAIHGSDGRVEIRLKDSNVIERHINQVEIYRDIALLLPLVRFPFISIDEEYESIIEHKHSLLKFLSVGQALLWEAFTIQTRPPYALHIEDHFITRHIQDHPIICVAPMFRDAQHRLQLNKKRCCTRENRRGIPSLSEEQRQHYRSMCFEDKAALT